MKQLRMKSILVVMAVVLLAGTLLAPSAVGAELPYQIADDVAFAEAEQLASPIILQDPFAGEPLYLAVKPGTPASQIPEITTFFWPNDQVGLWGEERELVVQVDEEAYQRGLAGGAPDFTIFGSYGPERLNPEDRALWDSGMMTIAPESAAAVLNIHVIREKEIKFSVKLVEWWDEDGYYPVFTFPNPFFAESVLFEASCDGITWYQDQQADFYGVSTPQETNRMSLTDDNGEPLFRLYPDQANYFRISVIGSAYDGMSGSLTLEALKEGETVGKDDDIDGNRGGGGQGESVRSHVVNPQNGPVDGLEPAPGASLVSEATKSPTNTENPANTEKTAIQEKPTIQEKPEDPEPKEPPESGQPEESAPTSGPLEEPVVSATVLAESPVFNAPPNELTISQVEAESPEDRGFSGAVAAGTAGLVFVGASVTYLRNRRIKKGNRK